MIFQTFVRNCPVPPPTADRDEMLDKLGYFCEAKAEREIGNDRYYPAAFGEPDPEGIYRWAVFDALEGRYLSDEEVLSLSDDELMRAQRFQ